MEQTNGRIGSSYEKERDQLVLSIHTGLDQVITNLTLLSRNLDSVVTIGRDFDNISALWTDFHDAIVQKDVNENVTR
ncbi:hypothetical protein BZG36_01732 [Bifiguratus adelaidae]|uniref:DASH complex subunit DAD1 n=1 Tax=Bifiguratus adelaidae TaxID=1938954 RepID=A0A261Y2X7_9FUNG|nr:hypothetical protein BZG36_01732 [Bifiguratus adelaidae]